MDLQQPTSLAFSYFNVIFSSDASTFNSDSTAH